MKTKQLIDAGKKDAVFQASIEFIGTLTGMKPPPIETAPPETFAQFMAFTERVCEIFAALEADIAKPVEPVALLSRWISDPELGAPARVIYSVKVLDFGKSLPTGDYMLYTTPQEPAAAGWMPIETAPTGTMILMANMNAMEARSWCFVGWMVDGRVCGHRMDDPTHWMSLPAAPGGAA